MAAVVAPPAVGALLDVRLTGIEGRLDAIEGRLATIEGDVAVLVATVAPIPAMQLQLNAIAAALGVAGASAAALAQAQAAARRANAVASDAPLVVVQTAGGGFPAAWPAGLDRAALWLLPGATANALLNDYALPAGGSIDGRRQRLARHIGALL